MRHAIITCCDARYGDFLLDHWLRSLQAHGNLSGGDVDVVVLDYGLSPEQLERLAAQGVRTRGCVRDGNVTNIRYRDIAEVLRESRYDQVLAIDGGDIIFQANIRCLLEENKDQFRAVREEFTINMHRKILGMKDFRDDSMREILRNLGDSPVINGGVLFGPADKFISLWDGFQAHCHSFQEFGSDQVLITYLLHKNGFVPLQERYNFSLLTTWTRFRIEKGVFRDETGSPIPIVHNSGGTPKVRTVSNFGFGPERNQRRWSRNQKLLRFYQVFVRLKRKALRWLRLEKRGNWSTADQRL